MESQASWLFRREDGFKPFVMRTRAAFTLETSSPFPLERSTYLNIQPDLVLLNGTIHTLDSQLPHVSALAIADGKILALGAEAPALAGAAAEVLDLHGAAVLPGLMDVHNHHMLAGQIDLFELNAVPTLGLDELLKELPRWAAELGPDEWIVGGSWGSGLPKELKSAEALARFDEASGGRPALIKDDSKHNRWANSRAMQLAGIDDATADPEGGQIFRDANGKATGVLLEAGGVLVEQARERLQPRAPGTCRGPRHTASGSFIPTASPASRMPRLPCS